MMRGAIKNCNRHVTGINQPDGRARRALPKPRASYCWYSEILSSPKIKNISLYPKYKSGHDSTRLPRPEGRIMIVTTVRWDAVDAKCR
jgi:hypothetical protein